MMTGGNNPSISVRKYIRWGDDPAGEDTSTEVLTSPLKSFVDLRIFLPIPLPPGYLPRSKLEWGFAGTSSSTPATNEKPPHTVWTHWVDSNYIKPEDVNDEGDMVVQATGEVLERGTMVNPKTGLLSDYVESWDNVEPVSDPGEKLGWVLKVEGDTVHGSVKGMIVRIGCKMQGILRTGENIAVGRWILSGEGKWKKIIDIGDLDLESDLGLGEPLKGGDAILVKAVEWHCVETFAWS